MTSIRFPRPLAFVFSGGLARAAGQIGMCEVALELGITPDLAVGTSTGAINAAMLAKDPANFHIAARALWHGVASDKALSSTWRSTFRGLAGKGSNRTQTMLRKHLDTAFGDVTREQLAFPLIAVSTDLESGHSSTTQGDTIVNTLLSSAAFPIIMPPVSVGDQLLIDGSVVAGVPVSQAIAAGARSVIVFDTGASAVSESEIDEIGWYEVLALAFTHLVRGQADHDLLLAARDVPVVTISMDQGSPFDLRTAPEIIHHGRDAASGVLLALSPRHGKDFRTVNKPGSYGNHNPTSDS